MPFLQFIDDETIMRFVKKVLDTGDKALKNKNLYKNVVDPFGSVFESHVFDVSTEEWLNREKMRQAQKSLQNAVGDFHQNLLGAIEGWENLGRGGQVDLKKSDNTIIAEVKNKHNTITGSKLIDHYNEFDNLVNKKASIYFNATAYFVQIIPKNPNEFDKPFTPSDKAKGIRAPHDERIREIDGRTFYSKVTGIETALDDLHSALPDIIERVSSADRKYSNADRDQLSALYKKAFISGD